MSKSEYPLSQEHRDNISQAKTGTKRAPFTQEHIENLSKANLGDKNPMYGKTHSDEAKIKMKKAATGRVFDAEVVARRAAKLKGQVRERKVCPYCNKEVAVNVYAQWHGDKCKLNSQK